MGWLVGKQEGDFAVCVLQLFVGVVVQLNPPHSGLHRALEPLNLRTIKSLRRFISKECLEVLTYSCEGQAAVADVADQINKITSSFLEHNPTFTGEFHLIGHGLGGCILLNILTTPAGDSTGDEADETVNSTVQVVDDGSADEDEEVAEETAPAQVPALPTLEEFFESQGFGEYLEKLKEEEITMETLLECGDSDYKELGFNMGQRKRIMKELKVRSTRFTCSVKTLSLELNRAGNEGASGQRGKIRSRACC